MIYVQWASVKGTANGVDTESNFMSWSKLPAAAGKYRIVKRFESETVPDGFKQKPTKEQVRAARKVAADAAKASKKEDKATASPQPPVIPSVPTPPEAVVKTDDQDDDE